LRIGQHGHGETVRAKRPWVTAGLSWASVAAQWR
jgi:hypothetical protein